MVVSWYRARLVRLVKALFLDDSCWFQRRSIATRIGNAPSSCEWMDFPMSVGSGISEWLPFDTECVLYDSTRQTGIVADLWSMYGIHYHELGILIHSFSASEQHCRYLVRLSLRYIYWGHKSPFSWLFTIFQKACRSRTGIPSADFGITNTWDQLSLRDTLGSCLWVTVELYPESRYHTSTLSYHSNIWLRSLGHRVDWKIVGAMSSTSYDSSGCL